MTPTQAALARMAARSVRRNWRHSLAAMLTIAVGFVAIGTFSGYIDAFFATNTEITRRRNMLADLIVERDGAQGADARVDPWKYALDDGDQAFIDGWMRGHGTATTARMRWLNVAGVATAGAAQGIFLGIGHDIAEGEKLRGPWRWNVTAGRPLAAEDAEEVVLGRGLGAILDCDGPDDPAPIDRLGHPVATARPYRCVNPDLKLQAATKGGQTNVITPKVAGLLTFGVQELDNRFLMMPLPLAQSLAQTSAVSMVGISLADPARSAELAQDLRRAARGAGRLLVATPYLDHPMADLLRRGLGLLTIYKLLVVAVVVSIAGMAVGTAMAKNVSERTREVGSLRALGFRRRHIVTLFALEAALLSALASAFGLCATLALALGVNASGVTYKAGMLSDAIALRIGVVPEVYAIAFCFLAVVAALATLLPAARAARLPIPEALSHG